MTFEQCKTIIYEETMLPTGFLWGTRENRVDRQQFQRLLGAVKELISLTDSSETVDKLIVACLFEAPWELENTEPHYSSIDKLQGQEISQMADELRMAIHVWLWTDLEEHYENIV